MCLSFLFYYPKLEISIALSQIAENELRTYFSKLPYVYLATCIHTQFYGFIFRI